MVGTVNGLRVGIQSWCFRGLEGNRDIIKALKELDIDGIELCGKHVDVNSSPDTGEVIGMYGANGITITSYGIDRYMNEEETVRNKFEFARKAGFKVLGADPDPDALELIDRLCGEFGMKIAIHNHGRDHRYGNARQLKEIFGKTSPNTGLCLDTAWALDAGEDPVLMIREFSQRLYGIHFKDFTFDAGNNPEEAVLGTGRLDLAGVLGALKEINFKGYTTIEFEGDVDNPVPSIRRCIEELKKY